MTGFDRFAALADEAFAGSLASFGFTSTRQECDEDFASRTYRAGDKYIRVWANAYFRDGAPHCGIYLGEGSDDWPEWDWNCITLWQLVYTANHGPDPARGGWRSVVKWVEALVRALSPGPPALPVDYPLASPSALPLVLSTIRADLFAYAEDFLAGSLERYRLARSRMNQQREPYKVFEPDVSGKYTVRYDPESAELKRRFS